MTPLITANTRIKLHCFIDNQHKSSITRGVVQCCSYDASNRQRQQQQQQQQQLKKYYNSSSYKFVDRIRLHATGGAGGKGCTSHFKYMNGNRRPNGGNGGHGGAVVLIASSKEQASLQLSKHHITATNGTNGSSNGRHGRNGRNTVIQVPCGVVVSRILDYHQYYDERTGEVKYHPGYEPYNEHNDDEDDEEEMIEELDEHDLNQSNHDEDDVNYWEEDTIQDGNPLEQEHKEEEEETEATSGLWTADHEGMYDAAFSTTNNVADSSQREESPSIQQDVIKTKKPIEKQLQEEEKEEEDEIELPREKLFLCDLDKPGSYVVVARGGRGGIGNEMDAQRQFSREVLRNSMLRAQSSPGESVFLELELKLIADIGLVGFPNAGKSSLLAAMSRAKPKIAPYPFTTLHPLVGIIEYKDGFRVAAADIPGLIQGAHAGRGRGYEFLRHLERTKALLYIVDVAGVDGRNPLDDIRVLAQELASYDNGELLYNRNALVVANKMDLIQTLEEREKLMIEIGLVAEEAGIQVLGGPSNVLGVSAGVTGEGLAVLSKEIRYIVSRTDSERLVISTN